MGAFVSLDTTECQCVVVPVTEEPVRVKMVEPVTPSVREVVACRRSKAVGVPPRRDWGL